MFYNFRLTNYSCYPPLIRAIYDNNLPQFKQLIEGRRMDAEEYLGYTLLHVAVLHQREEFVEHILSVDTSFIDKQNYAGETSLIIATQKVNVNIVRKLLESGADINKTDTYEKSPLFTVCESPMDLTIRVLRGEDACQGDPYNPMWTTYQLEIASMLIERGADVNATDVSLNTPLVMAVKQSAKQLVEFLLSKGANANLTDCFGLNPLMVSLMCAGCCAKVLLPHTADVNAKAVKYPPTLMLALKYLKVQECNEIIDELLERGANINVMDKDVTPLTLVVQRKDPTLLERLYEQFDERIYQNCQTTFIHTMIEDKWFCKYIACFHRVLDNPKSSIIVANTTKNETYLEYLFSTQAPMDENMLSIFRKLIQVGSTISRETLRMVLERTIGNRNEIVQDYMETILFNCSFSETEIIDSVLEYNPSIVAILVQYMIKERWVYIFLHNRLGFEGLHILLMHCTPPIEAHGMLRSSERICHNPGAKGFYQFALCLANTVPTLTEICRDTIRSSIRKRVGSIKEYRELVAEWEVPKVIKDIVQCVRIVNEPFEV